MNSSLLNIAEYITVNIFLFFSWYFLLFRSRRSLSFSDRLIGTFILGLSQIILTEMLLGIVFRNLFPAPLFLFNILISSSVLLITAVLIKREVSDRRKKDSGGLPGNIFAEFMNETVGAYRIIRKDRILLWIFRLFFISVCWLIFLGYLFPPYAWDSLWYHLPIVGYIIQGGAIQENPTPSMIDMFINIFPKNIELFFIWNAIFLKSNIVINLSQLPFTVVGVLTVYSIAVKLGLKKEHAFYPAFMFFFAPVVILQSTINYVDIAVAVLFLMAINFLVHDQFREGAGDGKGLSVLLAGLAAGILLGSKGSGPLFFVILSGAVVINEFVRRLKGEPVSVRQKLVLYIGCFIVPGILMGGYWYIKNWFLYGNPLYPFKISFMNITVFRGLYEGLVDPLPHVLKDMSSLVKPFYVWLEKTNYYLYDSRLSGFGPVWFILMLPSTVVAMIYAVKRKRHSFLFVGLILIITFILYPRNWYTRYVIFILAFGSLSFGLTLEYFKERQKAIKTVALLMVVYTFLTANSLCIMPWKIGEFLKMPVRERIIARHTPFNIDLQARQDYGLWIWVNNNMSEGDTLAYTFEPLFLSPLWNRGFTNKLVYIKAESYNEWQKEMKNNHVTHVLIKQNSAEDKWIKEISKLVYKSFWWGGVSKSFSKNFNVEYSDENYKVLRFKY